MRNFGERLKSIEPYIPATYSGQIRLDANESCFDLPLSLKEEIAENIKKIEFNRYPDPMATELCRKFADYYGIDAENVVAGNGSDELLSLMFCSILRPRSFVMVVSPDFSMYKFYADINRQNIMVFNKDMSKPFDCREVISTAEKADMIIFSNPCNPTSTGTFRQDILQAVATTKAIVVCDEAYMDFWDESVIDCVSSVDNLIVLKTCSKAFGLAAARVGFAVAGKELIDLFRRAKSPYNVSTPDQVVAETVLSHPEYLRERTRQIIELRSRLYKGLKPLLCGDMQMPEPKANFVRINTCRAEEVFNALKQKNILIRMPEKNLLRITVGTEEETDALLKAFKEVTE